MGDWSTETVLAHQMMRKLVSHEVDINGPFEPRIDGTFSRHFEVLQAIPVATAEVLNFPDLQIHILRHDEKNVSQILRGNPYSASEQNCFGQNSVHVAVIVGDLKVLQAILLHADASPLNTPDYAKLRDRYPIEYAPTPVFELILRYMTFTALGLRHSCCRLAQFDVVQDWDIKDMDEIMEEQHEETLRLEAFLEELEQDHRNSPDLETFVDVCWGPKVSMVIDELNARKLDEDDLKAAQETGIEWHCFETKTVENDYSRSSDLEYWMEKLNAIVPEPGSDIPLAPDLPVRDT
ncbi:hypothetical protein CGCF413_v001609 [Colletotrichum fructicola]|nr:hypothetical protein CGCF413_v001609 [Colletotrichum fructicola]